ncbi:MAG: hypothetical protein OHK0024_30000 [Thalassobaculales bacterium]
MRAARALAAAVALAALTWAAATAAAGEVPRTILALYNSKVEGGLRFAAVHRLAAMPLNWLGLRVVYHDVLQPLPELAGDPAMRGVLTWFVEPGLPDPPGFIAWAERAIAAGKRWVVMGDLGVTTDLSGTPTDPERVEDYLAAIGLSYAGDWSPVTHDTAVIAIDREMVEFERGLDLLTPFELYRASGPGARAFLTVRRADGAVSDLVTATRAGGFVAAGYTHFRDPNSPATQWHLNPFAFFRLAFATDDLPKPDVTTLSGRRLYYSHIDGDGWINRTLVPRYAKQRLYASEVVLREAIAPFPDLPVTVAPIAADLDPDWVGTEESREVARKIMALPQVEPASHTYSHPFDWDFFADYTPEKEKPFEAVYRAHRAGKFAGVSEGEAGADDHSQPYATPRAFAVRPFDVEMETAGAARYIAQFLPPGKSVALIQWSGNTSPWEGFIAASRRAGLRNINGGDSRYDADFPSVSTVAPVGRVVGRELQIYASNSNENTYTDLWTARYFGFRDVRETFRNTESPRRLKPINIYYHMYSGERLAALRALLDTIADARRQEIAPVTASEYAAIGEGFFTTRLIALGPLAWRVEDRGSLATLRFDDAAARVDWARSTGVIGQRRHQGALYVALDPAVAAPEVALRRDAEDGAEAIHLHQSRWSWRGLERHADGFAATARGWGEGAAEWRGLPPGRYLASAGDPPYWQAETEVSADGRLSLTLPATIGAEVPVKVTRQP